MSTKYIFVTGGVVSGLGKGITAASLGRLLKNMGYRIAIQKFDPYINVDPGIMSPYQHGEVYLTEDGIETDLDLGHYERFIDEDLDHLSSFTAGKIYNTIRKREFAGAYNGGTIQVIPHITNEIKSLIYKNAEDKDAQIAITEIGGTVGDIESQPFLEAIRQVGLEKGHENVLYVHVTLLPYLKISDELKTKPTQHSVKELRSIGIQPDIIVCRSEKHISRSIKDKISMFCDVDPDCVIENIDAESIYEIPVLLANEGIANMVVKKLNMKNHSLDLADWNKVIYEIHNPQRKIRIALVGQFVTFHESYLSVCEALKHGGFFNHCAVEIKWVDPIDVTRENMAETFSDVSGILVPAGFGDSGIEGMILVAEYAREHKIPYMGFCLGMQTAVIEFSRNVLGLYKANSTEFDKYTEFKAVDDLNDEVRLGGYSFEPVRNTMMARIYAGQNAITERHKHRYEINPEYTERMSEKGLKVCGMHNDLIDAMELLDHPFYILTQFQPEFKSRPTNPHPLMKAFIGAACGYVKQENNEK
ncbi:MAG: CTP synthase [Clostridia bacterium]|jgi:CTP synthase